MSANFAAELCRAVFCMFRVGFCCQIVYYLLLHVYFRVTANNGIDPLIRKGNLPFPFREMTQVRIQPSCGNFRSVFLVKVNPLTPTVDMGTAIKHFVPDRVKPSFVIFDIRAL